MKKRRSSVSLENMVEAQHILPSQVSILTSRRPSPLCALGTSIMFVYFCGIGLYMWTSNFACRLRNLGDPASIPLNSASFDMEQRGHYVVVKNYIRGVLQSERKKTVTFAAAATFPELGNVPEICSRWKGPMSVSVYTPGSDFKAALRKIFGLRLANPCVHQNVTWHLYFDLEFSPGKIRSPEVEADMASPSSSHHETWIKGTFKSHGHLPFPANVGRNVAVRESGTDFVLMSDLQYYPSTNIVPRFLNLLKYQGPTGHRVYVLPVFKMVGYGKPPETKSELVQMTADGNVVLSSGIPDCSRCNIFPHAQKWLEVRSPDDALSIYYVSKEKEEFESWQPFYISTRDIPIFDEDQIKEGKHDRKTQLLELCFRHYEFHILDNAFLVQVQDTAEVTKDVAALQSYVQRNNESREKRTLFLLCRYGSETGCSL